MKRLKLARARVFLYACFVKEAGVKGSRSLPNGCIFGLVSILLGLCLTVGTTLYQRDPDPTCHGGGLSAGFPLA